MEEHLSEENEQLKITVSIDKMKASGRFTSPTGFGSLLERDGILRILAETGITTGIDHESIRAFLDWREYGQDYVLARGIPVIQAKEGRIEYYFNANLDRTPKRNPDGSVDYKHLDIINHVDAGSLLARIHPGEEGLAGKNVYGEAIPPKMMKPPHFEYAENVRVSDDGLELHAMVAGHVDVIKGRVAVSDEYVIQGHVDTSTGNIEYGGNIHIKGDVKAGFAVEAAGDIVVDGVVESARLKSQGQIIVKQGIAGSGRLEAAGNIMAKFVENAVVIAGGYVESDSILNSHVSAAMDIRVRGKKGLVNGGVVRAGHTLEATAIGSEMETATRVEVGVDLKLKERHKELQQEIQDIHKTMEQIRPILQNYTEKASRKEPISEDNLKRIQVMSKIFKDKYLEMLAHQEELKDLMAQITRSGDARIKVNGSIYPGVQVAIADLGMVIRTKRDHVQMKKADGTIKILLL